jgi:hypothetical protein
MLTEMISPAALASTVSRICRGAAYSCIWLDTALRVDHIPRSRRLSPELDLAKIPMLVPDQ